MKIFHSELSANPGYYSFGYSVYGKMEASDTVTDAYDQGFLPAVVVKEENDLFYMCRGTRVDVAGFKELHQLGRVSRKFDEKDPKIHVVVHDRKDFAVTDSFVEFCLNYFKFRHGKDSMPKERLLAILNSPFLTHISEYLIAGKTVAYVLEVQTESLIHSWYYAYDKSHEGKHLGAYLLLDVIRRAKRAGKAHVYLGVTYGRHMEYKCIYQPVEYWNGREWVNDPKSAKLKQLLAVDDLRGVTFSDEWRSDKANFYKPPYAYTRNAEETRYLMTMMFRRPRIFLALLLVIMIPILVCTLTFYTR